MNLQANPDSLGAESRPAGPVNEPSTWQADEIAESQWQHYLTGAEINELTVATDNAMQRGLLPTQFGAEDFRLPTLSARLATIVDSVENGVGFAMVRGLPIQTYDEETLKVLYWGLGCHFGSAISQNSKGQLLAEVSDRGNSYADRNSRGFATNAELMPHVDTSDMTTLLCVRTARLGGESRVVSSSQVFNTVLAEHPEFLEPLFVGFHNDLRGEGPTGDISELTHHKVPVFSYKANRLSCSLNMRMIENGALKSGRPFSALERQALDFVREVSLREESGVRFFMQPGDIQMVSNHSVFHAREKFEDHIQPEKRRCLYRLWVNLANGRVLEPRFADRYNTGPRGGVAIGDGAQYTF
ncbi:MAG: TauD/TfdA family dioxygenase [Burkholderiaceae bacterium]